MTPRVVSGSFGSGFQRLDLLRARASYPVYSYPNLIDWVQFPPVAPAATPPPPTDVDIVGLFYNDAGLTSTALMQDQDNGWWGWYDWQWNHPTNTGDGQSSEGYDPARHPLPDFYNGDDPATLDWHCYWMANAGITVLSIEGSGIGFDSATWADPSNRYHWSYQLFHNVPNFQNFKYQLWIADELSTLAATKAQNDKVIAALQTYPNFHSIPDGADTLPVVFCWDFELLRGLTDNYNGQANLQAYLVELGGKFRTAGFDGVAIVARNLGFTTNSTVRNAGTLVLRGDYSEMYGPWTSYREYAQNVVFWDQPNEVNVVLNSGYTVRPHPSNFPLADPTPEMFKLALSKALNTITPSQKRFINIYNVAEWAEGGPGLVPERKDGFGYLNAIRDALAEFTP